MTAELFAVSACAEWLWSPRMRRIFSCRCCFGILLEVSFDVSGRGLGTMDRPSRRKFFEVLWYCGLV